MALKLRARSPEIVEATVQRQCDDEFVEELAEKVADADVVVSLGCGAGAQFLAKRFSPTRVVPGVNTRFIGVTLETGYWTEYCQACGDCVLHLTGGICPIARCSKSLLNGPCGGSSGGHCEIDPSVECGWHLIYDRMREQGRADELRRVIKPKSWRTSRDGGPRWIKREERRG
jgi:hypothetical protein